MKSKKTKLKEDLSDLMKELSDEEAGACVGGTGTLVSINADLGVVNVGAEIENPLGSRRGGHGTARSDRNQKEHFAAVDVQEILAKVATLPIETWNYKDQNQSIRHIGPMAQDFAAAFGVGEDDRFINVVDANGVALAAIQALYKRLQEKDAEIDTMRAELDDLKQQMLESKMQTSVAMPVAALNHN